MVNQQSNYKWYILTLVVLTNMFVVAMPAMGMSVLAKEISQDLSLNLVQVGVVWGVGSLPAILTLFGMVCLLMVRKANPNPIPLILENVPEQG